MPSFIAYNPFSPKEYIFQNSHNRCFVNSENVTEVCTILTNLVKIVSKLYKSFHDGYNSIQIENVPAKCGH